MEITFEFEQRWKDKYLIFLYLTNRTLHKFVCHFPSGVFSIFCAVPIIVLVLQRQAPPDSLSNTINCSLSWGTDLIGFVGKKHFINHWHFIPGAPLRVLFLLWVYTATFEFLQPHSPPARIITCQTLRIVAIQSNVLAKTQNSREEKRNQPYTTMK